MGIASADASRPAHSFHVDARVHTSEAPELIALPLVAGPMRIADVSSLRVADPDRVACVTQTTLSQQDTVPVIDALRKRFPSLAQPATSDICYATTNRQAAVAWLAERVQLVLVVGDRTSSNSRHLRDVAAASGTPAYLIGSAAELDEDWLSDVTVVGVSAGASTPDDVVANVVDYLRRQGAAVQEEVFVEERVSFRLPRHVVPATNATGSVACSAGF